VSSARMTTVPVVRLILAVNVMLGFTSKITNALPVRWLIVIVRSVLRFLFARCV
jgi:hypothetical protein